MEESFINLSSHGKMQPAIRKKVWKLNRQGCSENILKQPVKS